LLQIGFEIPKELSSHKKDILYNSPFKCRG